MRVLARITPGPAWLAGQPVWGQGAAAAAHLAYMRDRFDTGALLVGGPLRDGMSGMALLQVAHLDDAHALANADPGVVAGVLTYELTEVLTYFDAFDGVRTAAMTRETTS